MESYAAEVPLVGPLKQTALHRTVRLAKAKLRPQLMGFDFVQIYVCFSHGLIRANTKERSQIPPGTLSKIPFKAASLEIA
jgi:hypothetical protein